MIEIAKTELANGLRVVVHPSPYSAMATFNMLYSVGARDEDPSRTGFAHLFEHLMFGGSVNIPDFDTHVQLSGGDSNAYTNNDFTNYHITLPSHSIETAFWLESDRLLSPAFSPNGLEVQRKVVVEEFRQRYLNCPYGDISHLTRALAYKVHPYRWPTIGLKPQHIMDATLDEVKDFFFVHYAPDNAILSIAGNVRPDDMFRLAEKWFGPIERKAVHRPIAQEPEQTEARRQEVEADVPADRLYIAFHIGGRKSDSFRRADMLTDVLADGYSSRLEQSLVKGRRCCTDVNAYVNSSLDPGLMFLTAEIAEGERPEDVEGFLWEELGKIRREGLTDYEVTKVRNRQAASNLIGEISTQTKAERMAFFELLGDANGINEDAHVYDNITSDDIREFVGNTCKESNSSTLVYRAKRTKG